MITFTYFDNSQAIWVYPFSYTFKSWLYSDWNKKLKVEKLPTDLHAKHGYHKSPAIFECEAEGILEADKMLEEALNSGKVVLVGEKKKPKAYDVTKLPHISCTFEKLTFWKKVKIFLAKYGMKW